MVVKSAAAGVAMLRPYGKTVAVALAVVIPQMVSAQNPARVQPRVPHWVDVTPDGGGPVTGYSGTGTVVHFTVTSTYPGSPFLRGPIISATANDGRRTLIRSDPEQAFILVEQTRDPAGSPPERSGRISPAGCRWG